MRAAASLAHRYAPVAGGLAAAVLAGALCAWVRTPIPWMVGPLFAIAALRVSGVAVRAPIAARHIGQWIIGTALGLYFTPAVLRHVGVVWYLPLAGAAFAMLLGYVSGFVLARLAGIDRTTGVFASVPGGAAEMATLGDRFGARMDRVAAAQSLRILIVVAIVPAAFTLAGVHGTDAYATGPRTFDPIGFGALMLATLAGSLVSQWLGVPNAFVLGSLFVAIPLTAAEIELSALPAVVSNAAQLLLGCALGSRFERDSVRGAPRFVAAVCATVLVSIALSAAFGAVLALVSAQNVATMILGTAPGGIAEMAITAKVLQIGVPLVTAFHVTRVVTLLLLTSPLFSLARTLRRRR